MEKHTKIYLYSLPSCSKCQVLKKKLQDEGIEFKLIEDIETIQHEMYKAKTMSVPFIQIGKKYILDPTIDKIKEEL